MPPPTPEPTTRKAASTRARVLLIVISSLIGVAAVEIAVRVVAPCPIPGYSYQAPQKQFFQHDPALGWRGRPNAEGRFTSVDFDVAVKHDSGGFRTSGVPHAEGKRNVIVLGDSFGWGWGVGNADLFSEVMMQDDGLNVYNLSAPGYGTGQQLLVLRQFLDANPDKSFDGLVLLFCPANDYDDVAGGKRYGYAKPKFVLTDDELTVTNVPVPEKASAFAAEAPSEPPAGRPGRILLSSHVYNRLVIRKRVLSRMEAAIAEQYKPPAPETVALTHRLIQTIGDEAKTRGPPPSPSSCLPNRGGRGRRGTPIQCSPSCKTRRSGISTTTSM
jgi:hypothetical protein